MDWLRRLLGGPSRRGTLTLLDGNVAILGWPFDVPPTQEEFAKMQHLIESWASTGSRRPIVFPWPVDVIDQRTKR